MCNFINFLAKSNDPAPLFFNQDVQDLLKKLTRINMNKVFRHKKMENKKVEPPVYKFMTDDELKAVLEEANKTAVEMLQMPPVIKVREPVNEILSNDPALIGFEKCKLIFTDITFGISNRDRLIVIRHPDGTLAKADGDTRHRMNQVYFPEKGREICTPKMFENEQLKSLLERQEYEYVLDRACLQFEPDDPLYQKVTSLTYQHLNDTNNFEILRSTRHFGPLCFFLAWFKNIDNLIINLLETCHVNEINLLLNLHDTLHPTEALGVKDVKLASPDDTNLLEKYMKEKSAKKGQLELALQSYREVLKQRIELEEGIKMAHGVA